MNTRVIILTVCFALTIPLANFMIGNVGTECFPNGPCVVPVAPYIFAPSGVLMIGLALVLRDMVHEAGGLRAALIAITIGAIVSALFSPYSLLLASVGAFVLAELVDLAVYTPLRKKKIWLAVVLSGIAGSIVDSAFFLWFAFGSLDYLSGQIIGKTWMTLAVIPYFLHKSNCDIAGHDWKVCRDYGYGFTEKCKKCGKLVDRGIESI